MMFLISLVALISVASAFKPTAMRSTGSSMKMYLGQGDNTQALPWSSRPINIDESLPGYAAFDPWGFTNCLPEPIEGGDGDAFKWYREAEIVHGRVAQLAVLGFLVPSIYHFPGNPEVGVPVDAYANMDPMGALYSIPRWAVIQFALAAAWVEGGRFQNVLKGDAPVGDLGLGQGEGRWNPFNFDYTEEEYYEKQVQEIKHGRLAMLGALGCLLQYSKTGVGVAQQLGEAFSLPAAREVLKGDGYLGDYFPQGL